MSEFEWQSSTNPFFMLDWLRGRADGQALRRFAVRCCESLEGADRDSRIETALHVAIRYLDGLATPDDLKNAHKAAVGTLDFDSPLNQVGDSSWADVASMLTYSNAWHSAYCVSWVICRKQLSARAIQANLLREMFDYVVLSGGINPVA
ncbi:MAG: hypothetical protein IT428_16195 [Planctomycetaceae bacterium]|nr:hypothetical protein [Planctomycetaceae bacterium]